MKNESIGLILPTFERCRLGRFRSVLKCYSLWIKWVLKFLILWSDEINHSNFENATKCLNKSWWYLLKHACFILKFKDFCNTCVHFQWKKTNSNRHIGILSALRMRGLHDKRQLLAKLCIAGSENWKEEINKVSDIPFHIKLCFEFPGEIFHSNPSRFS